MLACKKRIPISKPSNPIKESIRVGIVVPWGANNRLKNLKPFSISTVVERRRYHCDDIQRRWAHQLDFSLKWRSATNLKRLQLAGPQEGASFVEQRLDDDQTVAGVAGGRRGRRGGTGRRRAPRRRARPSTTTGGDAGGDAAAIVGRRIDRRFRHSERRLRPIDHAAEDLPYFFWVKTIDKNPKQKSQRSVPINAAVR